MARRVNIGALSLVAALTHMGAESMRPKQDPRDPPPPPPPPPEPRQCGSCTLCCKTFQNHELNKPPDTWCQYARSRKSSTPGCSIYATRPNECRGFSCLWLIDDGRIFPGENHRPDRVGIVIDPMPQDQRNSFLHPIFREQSIMFLRVTQQHGGVWRQLKALNTLRNIIEAIEKPQPMFVIDEGPYWTLFDGKDERTMRALTHPLGYFWVSDDYKALAVQQLDKLAADPEYMAAREESARLLDGWSMADRGMAAQLEQNGTTFCTESKREKLERYAAFLRRRNPARKFEVRVVELPESLKRFNVEE